MLSIVDAFILLPGTGIGIHNTLALADYVCVPFPVELISQYTLITKEHNKKFVTRQLKNT